ncbi:DeoR/GlpR family DNA-binding transcription regulator [Kitasatospora sp. NPDC006697]|uniref:DeoR/GlpR family DNA-binding transcription regulator n=1 Tax=Kitasatospora sp. NPDC006697 TaxID=3364020 RepID=UPI0036C4DFC4
MPTTTAAETVLLTQQRRNEIRAQLHRDGAVRSNDLSRRLSVSGGTIRRDLAVLAAEGDARRVHGGAVSTARPAAQQNPPSGPSSGSAGHCAVLRVIARAAAAAVAPGTAIGLMGGRAAVALAEELAHRGDITVVTNSLAAADALGQRGAAGPSVLLTGGQYGPTGRLVGPLATASLEGLCLHTAFVDCEGADPELGLTVRDHLDAEMRGLLLRVADRRVLLAEPAVLGARSLVPFAALTELDEVFTDPDLRHARLAPFHPVLRAIGRADLGGPLRSSSWDEAEPVASPGLRGIRAVPQF